MARPFLTPAQQTLFDYLKQHLQEKGHAPSLRTAAQALSISHAAVAQTLKTLEAKKYIRRQGRYSRTLEICHHAPGLAPKQIPLVGRITAGLPIYAGQEWEETLLVDPRIFPGENLFALRVQGHSMKNGGILDQDIAICKPRQYAQNKEIVVALIHHEEATVKRFFLFSDRIELRPENPEFKPQTYAFDEVLIQGKVIGIIRPPQGKDLRQE